jgi:hypothetical protein
LTLKCPAKKGQILPIFSNSQEQSPVTINLKGPVEIDQIHPFLILYILYIDPKMASMEGSNPQFPPLKQPGAAPTLYLR